MEPQEWAFISRSKPPICFLSNLYGGAEFDYMSQRTMNERLQRLYLKLRSIEWDNNYALFKSLRIRLMGGGQLTKKYSDPTYNDPYRKGGKVAGGLIAKLMSTSYKNKKRLKIVNELADELLLDKGVILATDFTDGTYTQKAIWMLKALRRKSIQDKDDQNQNFDGFYASILKRGPPVIYEYPPIPRSSNDIWAGRKGLNAILLQVIRMSIENDPISPNDILIMIETGKKKYLERKAADIKMPNQPVGRSDVMIKAGEEKHLERKTADIKMVNQPVGRSDVMINDAKETFQKAPPDDTVVMINEKIGRLRRLDLKRKQKIYYIDSEPTTVVKLSHVKRVKRASPLAKPSVKG